MKHKFYAVVMASAFLFCMGTSEQVHAAPVSKTQIIQAIDINQADVDELAMLPGLGEKKAQAIVDYRKQSRFSRIEDLMEVPGIGEKLFAKIKSHIVVKK
jgi:competence protein ComEA